MEEELYQKALQTFSQSKYISPAKLQRVMQIPYVQASYILDRLIEEGHASPRIGAWPSNILRGRFRKIGVLKIKLLILIYTHIGYQPNPKDYLH